MCPMRYQGPVVINHGHSLDEETLTYDELTVLGTEGVAEHGRAQTEEGLIPGEDPQLTRHHKDGKVIATLHTHTNRLRMCDKLIYTFGFHW